jgi:hypothetical protein
MMVARSANKKSSSNNRRPFSPATPATPSVRPQATIPGAPSARPQDKPNVRYDQRPGARPLTKAELKAKDIYEATKEPEIVRLHALEDRKVCGT